MNRHDEMSQYVNKNKKFPPLIRLERKKENTALTDEHLFTPTYVTNNINLRQRQKMKPTEENID